MEKTSPLVAWSAGFYEGEGTILFRQGSLVMQASQQTRQPLEKMLEIYGGGIYETKQTATRKTIWVWYIAGHDVVTRVIIGMMPYLSDRRLEQAWDAIDRSRDNKDLREAYCKNLKHLRTEENTSVRANGARRCLACGRERWKERKVKV